MRLGAWRAGGPLLGPGTARPWRGVHGRPSPRVRAQQQQQGQGQPPAALDAAVAYRLLRVERGSSRREVRAAYIELIKDLHPDLNPDQDTTQAAAQLNAAYELVLAALESGSAGAGAGGSWDSEDDRLDVFDRPEAPPTKMFVNPFACYNVSPLLWEQLQQAVAGADDPEAALSRAGVGFDSGLCVVYLSPEQLRVLTQELERMSAAMDVVSIEVASFFVRDCLLRARVANNRFERAAAAA